MQLSSASKMSKRERCPNFSDAELRALLSMYVENADILQIVIRVTPTLSPTTSWKLPDAKKRSAIVTCMTGGMLWPLGVVDKSAPNSPTSHMISARPKR